MPDLVRLYIRNVIIGAGLAAVFVGALLALDVARLWTLISGSDIGWIAGLMLWVFHTIVFASVQFGIAVMRLGEDDTPRGGKRQRVALEPVRVAVPVRAARKR